jgi:hypothetical protein
VVSVEELDAAIAASPQPPTHIRVDATATAVPKKSLISTATSDDEARDLVMGLATRGFYAFRHTQGVTKFMKREYITAHWSAIQEGPLQVSENGIVYEYQPALNGDTQRLIVIFSPINSTVRLDRYVWPSFASLQKFVVPGTAILRVGDLGGVKGAFYLDTTYEPSNAGDVSRLIADIAASEGVESDKILLYGSSKGGTGALFHGLSNGWKFVSVDPIVSDEWYELNEDDYHFTSGTVFPRHKQEVFGELVQQAVDGKLPDISGGCVVTSWRSPQYDYIGEALMPLADSLTFFDSGNPEIKKHPDVAPKTISTQVMAMNALLLGLELPKSMTQVP